jgi:hypothetical protein
MRVALLVVLAATIPMFAQPADFSITVHAEVDGQRPATRVGIGETIHYIVQWNAAGAVEPVDRTIVIDVPGVLMNADVNGSLSCTDGDPVRCTLTNVRDPYGYLQVMARIEKPGTHTATARIIHPEGKPDPNPANDVATDTFDVLALPSLQLYPGVLLARIEPGVRVTLGATAQNSTATPATNVALTMTLTAGGTIVAADVRGGSGTCVIANATTAVCTAPSLGKDQYLNAEVAFIAPERMTGEGIVVEMAVTSAEEDLDLTDNRATRHAAMVRQFVVTNVQDEGSGSLRQAIHDVNALCPILQPCGIVFRIPAPVPENGWFTIQPRIPLPEIVATLKIDGATQTLFSGDTNADGPEIEINGALVAEGSGLRLRPNCDVQVRNLAINGFPGYGLQVRRLFEGHASDPCITGFSYALAVDIRNNYLGTDPRGRIAKPNQRGLGIFTLYSAVYANLISGNRRAGIYAGPGHITEIVNNRIGVASDGAPLGNGAGIFLDMGEPALGGYGGADIVENVIAHNDGMAIARTRRGEISVTGNSIFGNLQQGIDVDVDGPSPRRSDDQDVPNAPVLFSAAYDAAGNTTTVRGRIDSEHYANIRYIEIYASSALSKWGTSQAETWIARISINTGHEDFEIIVPADLRGKWITATYTVTRYTGFLRTDPRTIASQSHRASLPGDTSELSDAVGVQ